MIPFSAVPLRGLSPVNDRIYREQSFLRALSANISEFIILQNITLVNKGERGTKPDVYRFFHLCIFHRLILQKLIIGLKTLIFPLFR